MSKTKISEYSATANSNTDVGGINIDEGCAPSGINDAIRTLMAQLKNFQTGTGGDSFNGPVGTTTAATGAFTTLSATGVATFSAGSASAPALTTSGDTNTGIAFPAADTVAVATGGTERVRVDSSGNVGVGVVPSAWGSSYKTISINGSTLQASTSKGSQFGVGLNLFNNGTNYIYETSNFASLYFQTSGQHQWYTAASGTAGNAITFTQAMTLDASGNLGVGTTSPGQRFHIRTASGTASYMQVSQTSWRDWYVGIPANSASFVFYDASAGAERVRIDDSGNLLVGNTGLTGYRLSVQMSGSTPVRIDRATNTGNLVDFSNGAGVLGNISTNSFSISYNTTSDYRLKEVSGELTGYKERLLALQPKQGSWKINGSEFRGFLAHEFALSYPSAVNGDKDAVDNEGNPQYQSMQAGGSEVIADLVAYIKELETRLAALEQA